MSAFFAPGKLLLSAEYAVLQGAKAIAVPTHKGQHLEVKETQDGLIRYTALDHQGKAWLEFTIGQAQHPEERLVEDIIGPHLSALKTKGLHLSSRLDFPREWGLGSSSTFISLIAQWLQSDVWPLFFTHLKGSGYDVAVAESKSCIQYELTSPQQPSWQTVEIPDFFKDTGLLYLGQKQNSAKEVKRFLAQNQAPELVAQISNLSNRLLSLNHLAELETWMEEHERLSAKLIGLEPVPPRVLPEFTGSAKSLGAWGGDFLWFSRMENAANFKAAGFDQVFQFADLVDF